MKKLITLAVFITLNASAESRVSFRSDISESSIRSLVNNISRAARNLRADDERVIVIEMNSDGGDLQEAVRFAQSTYGLGASLGVRIDTRVKRGSSCESACTVLFTAGERRLASSRARFGFHSPKIESRIPRGWTQQALLDHFRGVWINAIAQVDGNLASTLDRGGYLMNENMRYLNGSQVYGGYVNALE